MSAAAALFLALSSPPAAAPPVTAGQLYADCRRAMEDTPAGSDIPVEFGGPPSCGAVAIVALSNHSIATGEPDYALPGVEPFCLPSSSGVSVENVRPLIPPFLRYFESQAETLRERDGRDAFLEAMRREWPCPARRRTSRPRP